MNEVFLSKNIYFEVWYMAWSESDRFWEFTNDDFNYNYSVFPGFTFKLKGAHFHINFKLLWKLFNTKFDVVIIGGYSTPSHILGAILANTKIKILWSETNYIPNKKSSSLLKWLKKILLKPFHYFLVPGVKSEEYIRSLKQNIKANQFLKLPNLINEKVFVYQVADAKLNAEKIVKIREFYGVDEKTSLWFCPARLEYFKGLDIFLPMLKNLTNYKLIIAGEGSQRKLLQNIINENKLNVDLVGQKNIDEIVSIYAASDLFVLPSVRDSSPLSAVEAIAAKLPVIISTNVGNITDVLRNEINGWEITPEQNDKNRNILSVISQLERKELAVMGLKSFELYQKYFNNDACINQHANDLLNIYEGRY